MNSLKPPGKKPLYEGSTQFRHWRFSHEQLAELREQLNDAAITAIRRTIEVDEPGSSINVAFLTADEERTLIKLYLTKIPQLCAHFHFGEDVEATAETYLKRFYLKNTVMDWHPKNVMLTALFLASKTANQPIPLEAYVSNIPKTTSSDVLGLEFLVAQSLAFELAVWPAHRALWGQWLDLVSDIKDEAVYEKAQNFVRRSRLTDAELVYTPSQIALACLSLASTPLAQSWIASHEASFVDGELITAVKALIVDEGTVPAVEVVREIDRRLKLCKNPEKVVGSRAYEKKKAEEEELANRKRQKKVHLARQAMENANPFGESIADLPDAPPIDDDDDD